MELVYWVHLVTDLAQQISRYVGIVVVSCVVILLSHVPFERLSWAERCEPAPRVRGSRNQSALLEGWDWNGTQLGLIFQLSSQSLNLASQPVDFAVLALQLALQSLALLIVDLL